VGTPKEATGNTIRKFHSALWQRVCSYCRRYATGDRCTRDETNESPTLLAGPRIFWLWNIPAYQTLIKGGTIWQNERSTDGRKLYNKVNNKWVVWIQCHQSVGCTPPKICSAFGSIFWKAMNVIKHYSDVYYANDVADVATYLLPGGDDANMTFL
jgi:hypothetical protein